MTKSLLSFQMCCCDTRLKEEEQTISHLQQVNLTAAKIPDIKKKFFSYAGKLYLVFASPQMGISWLLERSDHDSDGLWVGWASDQTRFGSCKMGGANDRGWG